MNCDYLKTCPIFEKFHSEGAKNIWISLYCHGYKQVECERKKLKDKGKEVPLTLLPNGTHMKTLKEEI